jgi:large subunit ribosomal protein L1
MGKMKTSFVGDEENIKNEKKHDQAHKGEAEKVHVAGLKGGQRVKIVEAAPTEETPVIEGSADVKKSGGRIIVEKVRGKKYVSAKANVTPGKAYPVKEAIKLVKSASYSKFDGTMELHLVVKKAGTSVQVNLPHSAGRQKKVEVASDATIEKLKDGKIDFDILVSTPEMMPKLVPFARLLGPKGMMPNPKNGTLVTDVKKAQGFSTGTVTLKTEKEAPLIHTVIGKNSQEDSEIEDNVEAILKALGGSKQIEKVYLKSTMSPSVKLQIA